MVMMMEYRIKAPYPKIEVEQKNPEYAKLIMQAYAGEVSEETAVHLYIYQNILLEDNQSEIAKILLEIAKVEMQHIDILGTLIKKLGVYPMYLDPDSLNRQFWSASYVDYNPDLKKMLEIDILAEKTAIADYKELIRIIPDHYIKDILKRIILDEELHLEIFTKILNSLQ